MGMRSVNRSFAAAAWVFGMPLIGAPAVARADDSPAAVSSYKARVDPAEPAWLHHEIGWDTAFAYLGGPSRVLAGAGGGPVYRLAVGPHFAAHANLRWLTYEGNTFTASTGFTYAFVLGIWRPAIGPELTLYTGDQIRVVTSEAPYPPSSTTFALQLVGEPLQFRKGRWSFA